MKKEKKQLFLCYAREDVVIAEKIYKDLIRYDLDVWFDKFSLLPGQKWEIEIKKAIKQSNYFLALLSSKSVNKRGFVQKELKEALEVINEFPESEVFIIPIRIEECEPNYILLKNLHWVDLFPSYKNGIKRILKALNVEEKSKLTIKNLPEIRINYSLNLNEVLDDVANKALKIIGAKNRILFFFLLNEESAKLKIKINQTKLDTNLAGYQIGKDQGIQGWVIQNKKYYLCSNVEKDPRYFNFFSNTKSEVCVPIVFGNKAIGVIDVVSSMENDFGEFEIEILSIVADKAAGPIENARLHESLAETQLQLTQAVDVALVGETLGGLTHDIRTVSSLISGETQWIEYLFKENKLSLQDSIESIKKIGKFIDRIELITGDIARRSQHSPIKFVKAKISDIVKECILLMSYKAQKYNINIDIDYNSLNFLAEVDEGKIKRAFINIIMNAIEAMPEGGSLNINAIRNDFCFEIIFKDSGKGFSKLDIDKVWNRFFTTKQDVGIGLAICKRIIEGDHKGTITVKSEINKGTTVTIKLPLLQT